MSYQWVQTPHGPRQLVPQSSYRPPPLLGPPARILYPVEFCPSLPQMPSPGYPFSARVPTAPELVTPQHVNPNLQFCPQPFQPILPHQGPVYHPPAYFLPQTGPVGQPNASGGPYQAHVPLETTLREPTAISTVSEIKRAEAIKADYDLLPFWLKLGHSSSQTTAGPQMPQTLNMAEPAAPRSTANFRFFPKSSIGISPAATVQLEPHASTSTKISEAENQEGTASATKPFCRFCKKNGESERFYESHVLKTETGETACPVLRKLKCTLCGKQGDEAHTLKHCDLYVPPPGQVQKFGRNACGRVTKIIY